jgi:hypothetical protein
MKQARVFCGVSVALGLFVAGCSSTSVAPSSGDASAETDGAPQDAGAPEAGAGIRGTRYCEILVGTLEGSNVHVAVYTTAGLSDCPQAEWAKLDEATLKAETKAALVKLNGPRYWMIDSLQSSMLLDPTPRSFGGIEMRQAGALDFPLAEAQQQQTPYTTHTITRDSRFTFGAGKPVFELVDDAGHVYTMQSYSAQKVAQTEATLGALGGSLSLPSGWSFRTRTLEADVVVQAADKQATVVQDENENTYLRSQ